MKRQLARLWDREWNLGVGPVRVRFTAWPLTVPRPLLYVDGSYLALGIELGNGTSDPVLQAYLTFEDTPEAIAGLLWRVEKALR